MWGYSDVLGTRWIIDQQTPDTVTETDDTQQDTSDSAADSGGDGIEDVLGDPELEGDLDTVFGDITNPGEWVYPNEQERSDTSEVVGVHKNPDGSEVIVYNDGSTHWEKAPENFDDWPDEPTNQPGHPATDEVITDWYYVGFPNRKGRTPTIEEVLEKADQVGLDEETVRDALPEVFGEGGGNNDGTGDGEGAGDGSGDGDDTGDDNGTDTGDGDDDGTGDTPGDGTGDEPGDGTGSGVGLFSLLSPTRTTDMLFKDEFDLDSLIETSLLDNTLFGQFLRRP